MFLTQGFASEPRYLSLLMTIYVLFLLQYHTFQGKIYKKESNDVTH